MKNKNRISAGLLIIIGLLITVTTYYASINFNKYEDTMEDDSSTSTSAPTDDYDKLRFIENFKDFNKYINSENGTFIVFGKENCSFCSQYKPVLSRIVSNYDVEIAYVNMTSLSEDDYYNVMNSDLVIPAKCVKEGVDIKLKEGFGTPLGLFVKNGSVYDCVRGYNDYETTEILLRTIGYIK